MLKMIKPYSQIVSLLLTLYSLKVVGTIYKAHQSSELDEQDLRLKVKMLKKIVVFIGVNLSIINSSKVQILLD